MKRKYLQMKLAIVEKEIDKLEVKENNAVVNLREQKKKQWELIEQLEAMEENNQ